MFNKLITAIPILSFFCGFSLLSADCCQSVECSVGWRRDSLDWNTHDLDSSYICGHANSRLHFNDINSYALSGKAKWVDSDYYIRFSAEYGLTDKGRIHERFQIKSPFLCHPLEIETSTRLKRRSEVYDFSAAVGYPFTFFCCRFSAVPLIGFSFHRQHLRFKEDRHSSSCSCSSSCYSSCSSSSCSSCSSCSSHSHSCSCSSHSSSHHSSKSSSFDISSSNPFRHSPSSNPFGSRSDPNIASALGLSNPHRTSNYRFTWYGFYIGLDLAYALDPTWTLFSELEWHFLDNCHRKRQSWTGVYFVDHHHKKGWAYGFNGVVGLTYYIASCWYSTISVDFNWWKGDAKNDTLEWKKVGAKIGLGYMF